MRSYHLIFIVILAALPTHASPWGHSLKALMIACFGQEKGKLKVDDARQSPVKPFDIKPFDPASTTLDLGDLGRDYVSTGSVARINLRRLIDRIESETMWQRLSDFLDSEFPPTARSSREHQFIGRDRDGSLSWDFEMFGDVNPRNWDSGRKSLNQAMKTMNIKIEKMMTELNSKITKGHYKFKQAAVIWGSKNSSPYIPEPHRHREGVISVVVNLMGNGSVFSETNRSLNEGEAVIFAMEEHFSNPIPSKKKLFLGLALEYIGSK